MVYANGEGTMDKELFNMKGITSTPSEEKGGVFYLQDIGKRMKAKPAPALSPKALARIEKSKFHRVGLKTSPSVK